MKSLLLMLALTLAVGSYGADVKITALPTTNAVHTPDIFPLVTQPGGGSAATKSATLGVIAKSLSADQGMITNGGTANALTLTGNTAWGNGDHFNSAGSATFAGSAVTIDASGNISGNNINANLFSGSGAGLFSIPAATAFSGNFAIGNFNSGTSASATTFWRGDGTWATPAGSGTVTSVGASGPAGFTWSSAVTGSGTLTATTPSAVLTNGAIGYFSSVNVTGTGPTVIYGDANGTNALVVKASGITYTNAAVTWSIGNTGTTNSGSYVSTNGQFIGNAAGLTNLPIAAVVAPSPVLTNGFTGSMFFNNASNNFLGLIQVAQEIYPTNSGNGLQPNFGFVAQYLSTNAAFTLTTPTAVNPNNFETTVFFVTNTTAAVVNISTTGVAANNKIGTFNVTNFTVLTYAHWGNVWTNIVSTPMF